jgi:hypothetical protein
MDKLDHQAQIQLKKELKKTTENLGDVDLDEETELALEDQDSDRTEQDILTGEADSDTETSDDDSGNDPANDPADVEGTVVNSEQGIVTEQMTNPGQVNKEEKEENNNQKNHVFEDGHSDEIQNDDNNGAGKNDGRGKGKKQ